MIGAQPVLIDFAASIFERRMYGAEMARRCSGTSAAVRWGRGCIAWPSGEIRLQSPTARNSSICSSRIRGGLWCSWSAAGRSVRARTNSTGMIPSNWSAPMSMRRRIPCWWPTPTDCRLTTACLMASGCRRCWSTCWIQHRSSAKCTGCFGRRAGLCRDAVHAAGSRARLRFLALYAKRSSLAVQTIFGDSAGPVGGAGVALTWSIRYFSRALGAGNKLSRLISLPFFCQVSRCIRPWPGSSRRRKRRLLPRAQGREGDRSSHHAGILQPARKISPGSHGRIRKDP